MSRTDPCYLHPAWNPSSGWSWDLVPLTWAPHSHPHPCLPCPPLAAAQANHSWQDKGRVGQGGSGVSPVGVWSLQELVMGSGGQGSAPGAANRISPIQPRPRRPQHGATRKRRGCRTVQSVRPAVSVPQHMVTRPGHQPVTRHSSACKPPPGASLQLCGSPARRPDSETLVPWGL